MASNQTAAQALKARLQELTRRVDDLETDLRQPLDADFAEQAAELQDDEALSALEDAGRAEIVRIKAALSRIEDGTYGICVTCGGEIAPARLAALPAAIQCFRCATVSAQAR